MDWLQPPLAIAAGCYSMHVRQAWTLSQGSDDGGRVHTASSAASHLVLCGGGPAAAAAEALRPSSSISRSIDSGSCGGGDTCAFVREHQQCSPGGSRTTTLGKTENAQRRAQFSLCLPQRDRGGVEYYRARRYSHGV